ncbi:MAG: ABC transporter permease subunit, partial [Alphaproteobacteria bacterium]|nr:ABC transporter permease subunit [Alphaproteobacteria bacterium]
AIPAKRAVYGLVLLPLILPHIITATAFLLFFSSLRAVDGTVAIAIAHGILGMPLAVIIISASLQAMDQRLEQAAMSLGASASRAFVSVTLPLLAPAILSAALFGFLSSFDELLVALFLADPGTQPLAVMIWKTVLYDLEPTIAAVSVLLIALATLVVLASSFLSTRRRAPSSAS